MARPRTHPHWGRAVPWAVLPSLQPNTTQPPCFSWILSISAGSPDITAAEGCVWSGSLLCHFLLSIS
jgi:hypothetical protein